MDKKITEYWEREWAKHWEKIIAMYITKKRIKNIYQ